MMSPRLTDWTLALGTGVALATGIISLISGETWQWFVFAAHGMAGLWLLLVVERKVRRIWPRLVMPRRWNRGTLIGAGSLAIVALTLGTGIAWAWGGELVVAGYNLLNWHIILSIGVMLLVSWHMLVRAKPLRPADVGGRRRLLESAARVGIGVALWPTQQVLVALLGLPGARRRFTGSREAGSYMGNAFPTSSWVADNPPPVDVATWHLTVGGMVAHPLTLAYQDLAGAGESLTATLDCTGGFYSTQHWQGLRVGTLLERAGPRPEARYVSFVSVTGYRWSLPLDEARGALLATHVGTEPLNHDHGAPARLIAPGRRGFEWVKWLDHIEVLEWPDAGQILSIWVK